MLSSNTFRAAYEMHSIPSTGIKQIITNMKKKRPANTLIEIRGYFVCPPPLLLLLLPTQPRYPEIFVLGRESIRNRCFHECGMIFMA